MAGHRTQRTSAVRNRRLDRCRAQRRKALNPIKPRELDSNFQFPDTGKPLFIIDLEGRSVELLPNQGFVVPKGVMHCTRAPEKSVVETAAIVPTGDA